MDVFYLAFEEEGGLLGLGDGIDACRAAAPVGLGEGDEGDAGDEGDEGAGLAGDFLAVGEVAGVVVGDGDGLWERGLGWRDDFNFC